MQPTRLDLDPWDHPALLDHAGELRSDQEALRGLWADPGARVLELDSENRFLLDAFGRPTSGPLGPGTAFLGLAEGRAWFARRTAEPGLVTLREAALGPLQRQIVAAGAAILNWQELARHCEVCGNPLLLTLDGFSARCTHCERDRFPRTDPAVIVAVVDQADRLLLAHQRLWQAGRVSILAGFVEAGESAENAVHREVGEESSLQLSALRYLGSQPWPFPRSLMLGYVARAAGVPEVDGQELEWGRWFSREHLRAELEAGGVIIPGSGSIARRIIEAWRTRLLPAPEG